jgi:ankyrin repeat protein
METITPILQAVKNGHLEAVELLLRLNAKPCWWCRKHAIMYDDIDMLKLLASYDVIIYNNTHLRLAAMHGSINVGRYIIEYGVDVSNTSHTGWTALHYAITYGHASFVKLILDNNPSQEDLYMAGYALSNKTTYPCIQQLIDHGIDISGMIFLAIENNMYYMTMWLLDHGIDINIRDNDASYTLLHTAVAYASNQDPYDIIKLLMDRGIDVHALDVYGNTAFDLANSDEFGPHIVRIVELLRSA